MSVAQNARAASMDFVERTSYVSSTKDYIDLKTPGHALEDGALREGGAANLYTKEYIGLLAQYAGVGIIYGALPATVNPFFQQYLQMETTQVQSVKVMLSLPWSFKVLYGVVSDCVPVFGYRRRPYMVLGWIICAVMLFIQAFLTVPAPFYSNWHDRKNKTPVEKLDPKLVNLDAPDYGHKFVMLMLLSAFGYVMSDVAADAVVCELAQREPIAVRGKTQTTIYLVRSIFMTFSMILIGFGFNGHDYGGEFDWTISFSTMMIILGVCTLPVIPISWFYIHEEKAERQSMSTYFAGLWDLVQNRVVYQVIAYRFFSQLFESISYVPASYIGYQWAHVEPLNENIIGIVGQVIFSVVLYYTQKVGLGWDWRYMMFITEIGVIVIDSIPSVLTVWDVVRNQWFFLGVPLLDNLPSGIHFIVGTYIVVELADMGNEGAVYGLITTVSNLSTPVATTIYKNIDMHFDVTKNDIKMDTHHVRKDVTYTMLIAYACKLFSLVFLVWLPRQKAEVQELRRNGGRSKFMGALTIAYITFSFGWSVMTNMMSIYPSTACLRIAGGKGCHAHKK